MKSTLTFLDSARRHRFFAVAVSAVAVLVDNLFFAIVLPLLPTYASWLSLSTLQIGGLVASYASVMIAACPVAAFLCDRSGPRLPLLIGLFAMLLATLLFALAESFALIVVARMLQGVTGAVTWTAALAMIPLALPANEQGRATSVVVAVGGLGGVIGPVISGSLFAAGGIQAPFWFMLAMISVDLCMRLLMIDPPPAVLSENESRSFSSFIAGVRQLLADGGVALLLMATVQSALQEAFAMPLLPILIAARFSPIEPLGIGLVLGCRAFTYLTFAGLFGWLSDRGLGRTCMSLGAVFLPLSFIAAAFVESLPAFVIVMLLSGVALTATATPNMSELAVQITNRHSPRMFAVSGALQNLLWAVSTTIAPLISTSVSTDTVTSLWGVSCTMLPPALVFCFFACVPRWSVRLFGPLPAKQEAEERKESDEEPLAGEAKSDWNALADKIEIL
jgi:MFS family permease